MQTEQLCFEAYGVSSQRRVPRPFSFPWGGGQIVEEVAFRGAHHEPCIQLLEFTDGFELVRFCSYTLSGRFERNSWIAGRRELEGLADRLRATPRLREALSRLLLIQCQPNLRQS
jgi:hypothetical protein